MSYYLAFIRSIQTFNKLYIIHYNVVVHSYKDILSSSQCSVVVNNHTTVFYYVVIHYYIFMKL